MHSYKNGNSQWITKSRTRQQKSIQRASSQSNAVDGSISCISPRVEGGSGQVICPCWWGALSGLTSEPGPHPSRDMGPILCFVVSRGECMISRTQIQYVYGDALPIQVLLVTLIPHVLTRPSPFPPSPSASHSSPHPLINFHSTLCSPHFLSRYVSSSLLHSLPTSAFSLNLSTALYLIASIKLFFFFLFWGDVCSHARFSPSLSPFPSRYLLIHLIHPFPEGVDWRCDGMMSQQRSSVSGDDCQLGQTLINLLHC